MTTSSKTIKTFKDLEVYQLAYQLAMKIFLATKTFPPDEKFSLTDQIRRSSRSIAVNIAEGWGKRSYENLFKRLLIDAAGSIQETKSWLSFSMDCGYISPDVYREFLDLYETLGAKLFRLTGRWKTFETQPSDF